MGVPSLYRWLVNKYPKIVVNAEEERAKRDGAILDISLPNPNGLEFDNLYLDMNGIIHSCFHPEGDHPLPPQNFDDVFNNMFDYIDRLFRIVRPRKLLYLAIDGVAPRAKMNQQRSRHFRTAKDCEIAEMEEERLRREFEREGNYVFPKDESQVSDSNIITPGTEFMDEWSKALQSYVIISDATVPGEGEHKIMSFIRAQRSFHDYVPDTRHCIYGLDADLIMLVLSTHEVNFSILREGIFIPEHPRYQPTRKANIGEVELSCLKTKAVAKCCDSKPYQGGIDLLMHVYKEEFKKNGGYLVDVQYVEDDKMRYINLKRVEKFISVSEKEEPIFKKRTELRERMLRRLVSQCSNVEEDIDELTSSPQSLSIPFESAASSKKANKSATEENTRELKERLTCWSRDRVDLFKDGSFLVDKVKLGSTGWKQRYYKEKLNAETKEDIESTRRALVQKYTEGICWMLLYYFSGVPSWDWFYDYHYGPFASDLRGMSTVRVKFKKGVPFKPLDQLMGALPPRSGYALPKVHRELMTSTDSSILDFYPSDFEVDTDGKRFLWQGICKLPFIDEKRLTSATEKLEVELNDDEKIRNSTKNDILFVRRFSGLGLQIFSVYKKKLHQKSTEVIREIIPAHLSCGINGLISPLDEISTMLNLTGDESQKDFNNIEDDNSVVCVQYLLLNNGPHYPRPLANKFPEKTIYEADITEVPLWHEQRGSRTSYRMGPGRGKELNPSIDGVENSSSFARTAIGYVHDKGVGRGRGFQNRQNYRPSQSERGHNIGYYSSYGRGGESYDKPWRQPNVVLDDGQKYNAQIQKRNVGSINTNGGRGRGRNLPTANANSSGDWRVKGDSRK